MKEIKYNFYVAQLITKLLKGEISEQEKKELQDWRGKNAQNLSLYNKLIDPAYLGRQQIELDTTDINQNWNSVLEKIKKGKRKPFVYLKYAAAISAIIFSIYFFYFRKSVANNLSDRSKTLISQRIAPGGKNATLILSNGDKVDLRSSGRDILDKNSRVELTNENNILKYADESTSMEDKKVLYNTIIIPKGGEYQLLLADGTQVWMNSLSHLRYPTKFSHSQRQVYLSGEAYFQVAKDASRKFIVTTNKTEIEVLGTHFNISAYEDDDNTTTLLEGAVRLLGQKSKSILSPGQQAIVDADGLIKSIRKVDVNKSIDWKNGFFELENSDIRQIMTKAARWYDIEVSFESNIPENKLYGRISRDVDFAELLEILRFEGVNIQVSGKHVLIKKGH